MMLGFLFFCKQKTAYEMRISGWSSDVCSSDLYYFCSAKGRERFEARPEIFLGDAPAVVPQGSKDLIYTCPMHPEIEQVGPGTCPICGMALEPKGAALPEGPSKEYLDMRRRFVVSALLSVPLVLVAMLRHLWMGFGARSEEH